MLKKSMEEIALIESDYFEYLSEENGKYEWKKFIIQELPFIPVIIKINTHNNNETIHELTYELPYTHEIIIPKIRELFISENGKIKKQIKIINEEYENTNQNLIRLNNEKINTIKKIRKNDIPLEYIAKKRRHLFKLLNLLKQKPKVKTKKVQK